MDDNIQCKSCGARYVKETRICVQCGFDMRTGKSFQTQVSVEEVEPEGAVPRGQLIGEVIRQLVPGLFEPLIAVLSGLGLIVASFIGAYAIWALTEEEVTGGAAMIGLALVINAQAMAWIVTGELQSLVNAVVEMSGRFVVFVVLIVVTLGALAPLIACFLPIDPA